MTAILFLAFILCVGIVLFGGFCGAMESYELWKLRQIKEQVEKERKEKEEFEKLSDPNFDPLSEIKNNETKNKNEQTTKIDNGDCVERDY